MDTSIDVFDVWLICVFKINDLGLGQRICIHLCTCIHRHIGYIRDKKNKNIHDTVSPIFNLCIHVYLDDRNVDLQTYVLDSRSVILSGP